MQKNTETAVILAAGWGSRVQGLAKEGEAISKPLIELESVPMVVRVIKTLVKAGIKKVVVVTGYMNEKVEAAVLPLADELGVQVQAVFNPKWDTLANGVSLLAAKVAVEEPFLLSMSDHVYDVTTAKTLIEDGLSNKGARLCIDRKIDQVFDLDDATKVVTEEDRIVQIGKMLPEYNAIDIGLFHCLPEVFENLQGVYDKKGDCSISDGMGNLGAQGRFGYFDIGEALWQDVDTPETLEYAQKLLSQGKIHFEK